MQIPNVAEVLQEYTEFDGIHPAADLFPLPCEDDFISMVADIKEHGLKVPLLRYDGLLLDGRSRMLACYVARVDIRINDDPMTIDPYISSWSLNGPRRHLSAGQKAMVGASMRDHYDQEAKARQVAAGVDHGRGQKIASGSLSRSEKEKESDRPRDQVAAIVKCSGKSIDKARDVNEYAPEIAGDVKSGKVSLEAAHKVAKKAKQEAPKTPKPVVLMRETVPIICVDGRSVQVGKPKKPTFNATNDNVEWAAWTWNPVTGCNHGCDFCYARAIATTERMKPYYPFGFAPAFRKFALVAPINTKRPQSDDPRDGRVFVCSMADLFGKWVPDKWIQAVFDACLSAPEWEYLFLTKWPKRYASMPLIGGAWYGASVIKQADVARVARDMLAFNSGDAVKWVSLEPLLEPIVFGDLSWCDLMVIGGQTATNQPNGRVDEFAPDFDWIVDIVNQCRAQGVPYYLKPNVGLSAPGMNLPKSLPR